MKILKIISVIIFVAMVVYLRNITVVGLSQPVQLSDLPFGLEKAYIWYIIILSATGFAIIPWVPVFFRKYFKVN